MRTLFVLCTAVTVLQVFDVSITGISAAKEAPKKDAGTGTLANTAPRAIKKANSTNAKPADPVKPQPDPVNNNPGSNPDNDSMETDPPNTVFGSGKKVAKTMKKVASKRIVGVLNSVDRLLNVVGHSDSFGNLIQEQANNVRTLATESLKLVSDFSNSSFNGAKHVIEGSRVIGKQGGNVLFSTLQKATTLGANLTKFGGTAINTPISIGGDIVGTANRIAKAPSLISTMVTNNIINRGLRLLRLNSDEEPEKSEEEEKEEPPKAAPSKPKSPNSKSSNTKSTK